jgi:hypothetical protein
MIEETLNAILAELKAHHEWCRVQQVEFEKGQARWEALTYPGTPEGKFPTSQVQSTEPAPVVEAVARPEPPGKPVVDLTFKIVGPTETYTKEQVGKALMALCEMEGGRDKAAAVLAKFGADRLSAIKEEDYASAIATIEGMKA